jgi:hypothetical protein
MARLITTWRLSRTRRESPVPPLSERLAAYAVGDDERLPGQTIHPDEYVRMGAVVELPEAEKRIRLRRS